jgi:teichuronic acid biosynthesis glycosyltransferase TuaG
MVTTQNAPFFSIILPAYNGELFISDTIQSIIDQTFQLWELIIVNDGSTDTTENIVTNYAVVDHRIKLINQANKKQPAARNTGMKIAAGEWIAFIDSDDLWLPTKLELQYNCIAKNSELDVVFTDGYTKYEDKRIRHYYHFEVAKGLFQGKDLYRKMMFGNLIPILSVVVKKSWVEKIGHQDERVPGVEDHDYWLRLCRAGANFYGMEERLFIYRIHDSNFSANLANQHHLSLIIRLNNYDMPLLTADDNRKFKKAFEQYLKYFREQGKAEWEPDLKARYTRLNIPKDPLTDHLKRELHFKIKTAPFTFKRNLKSLFFYLIELFYFYPKKKLHNFQNDVAKRYTYWRNFKSIAKFGDIDISLTARINFYNERASSLDVQSMYVGDFSRINFVEENSKWTAGADVNIGKFCNFNIVGQLTVGNNVLFNNHSTLTCHHEIIIGDDTWFGEGVRLYDHNHNYKQRNIPFTQQGYTNGKIKVGNNVWVGSNTIILKDVSIGDGCVIGANNVIYKSLPKNSIVKSRSMEVVDVLK